MTTSFIILNYKSQKYLAKCISTLKKHAADVVYEIILINNDIDPISTIEAFGNVRIINNNENLGFARACNQGAKLATGDTLFFLNPDTEFIDGNIYDLINALEDSTVGIAAPQLVLPNGKVQPWSAGYEITPWSIIRNNFGYIKSSVLWSGQGASESDWVSGAAFAIRKSLFDEVGGFDENFFMYFEDVDLCRRMKNLQKKIIVVPSVKVLHFGGQSSPSPKIQKRCYYDSQDHYFKKHFGFFQMHVIKFLRIISTPFSKH